MNLSQKVLFNTVLLTVSRLLIAATGVAGTALSTRYLGVRDFGELTTAVVFVSLFNLFTDAGVWLVATREMAKRPHDEERILANVMAVGLALSAVAIGVTLGVMLIAYGPERHLVRAGVLILAIQMLFAAPAGVSVAYMNARQRAGPAAVGSIVASGATADSKTARGA